MKKILLIMLLGIAFSGLQAQYIHKIKADSVLITNDSCNAELNLENSTRNVKGFLFNKGNGRTEFRKAAVKLNDSTYIIGADTLTIGPSGNFIRNQYTAAQAASYWISGPARVDNSMIISVPDTGASTQPYSYTHTPSIQALRIGTNDAPISSLNNNALISFGRHYGPGIMIYDNLNTKVDCFGIGIVPGAMEFYASSAWNPAYFTWTAGGYQPTLGTNELMRLKNNGNLMLGTTTDNGFKVQIAGVYSQGGNRIEVNNSTLGGSGNVFLITSNSLQYLKMNSGNFNTFLGSAAGGNNAVFGTSNTGMGFNSLLNVNSSSINNSGFGVNTLRALTSGGHNTAAGVNAGLFMTTGSNNTLIGTSAGGVLTTHSNNTIVGLAGMFGTNLGAPDGGPTGNENTAIGYNAGGSNKTMAQWNAAATTYTGSIFIGTRNGKSTAGGNLTATTLIGNSLLTDLSNILVLGSAGQNIILTNSNTVSTDAGAKLQIDAPAGHAALQIRQSYTPTSSADPAGSVGTWAWDDNYIYIKTSSGWKRAALSTF